MKKYFFAVIILALFVAPYASANSVMLSIWAFNVNGTHYYSEAGSPPLPANFDTSAFDFTTGYGQVIITFSSPGSYNVASFFDIEAGLPINDDLGQTSPVGPPAGLTWEIGNPYGNVSGSIADDFWGVFPDYLAALTNTNLVGGGEHDDISMALGLQFNLASGFATVRFDLSPNEPPSGFYLEQIGPQGNFVFFTGDVSYSETVIPEPGTLALLGTGLFGLAAKYRRRS